ncbi:MAG: DNA-binding protein [Sandaracinus sp.]
MNLNDEIARRINAFVAELDALVRQSAMDSVSRAFGAGASSPRVSSTSPRRSAPAAAAAPTSAPASGLRLPRLKKGQKRDPKDLERIVAAVRDHVKAHPGEGVEHIAKHLGVATKEITLPIAKLLDAKTITKRGVKRATRYFPS